DRLEFDGQSDERLDRAVASRFGVHADLGVLADLEFGLRLFALRRVRRHITLHLLAGRADHDLSPACLAAWRIDQDVDDERAVLAQLRPRLVGGRYGFRRWLDGLLGKVHASLRVNLPATQTSWLVSIGSLRMRLPVS